SALTRQLLAFSRKQVLVPEVVPVADLIEELSKMLRRLIGEDIELVTLLPSAAAVKADPGQLEQVLMNLAVNARDAMPNGGKLTLETGNVDLGASYAADHYPARAGPFVLLAVSDTGIGMNEETQAHMFEPFFTTKERGKGTGLGLATVYGIIKQSGGFIWVYSEVGHGTTFKLYLPRVEELAERAAAPAQARTRPARGTETVLVVEDEAPVRNVARQVLERHGYTVLEAPSAEAALDIATRYSGAIHLLLTDVVMPGLNGRELASRLADLRPDARVIFMSGYTDDAVTRHGVLEPGSAYVQKPFTPDSIARRVREVFDPTQAEQFMEYIRTALATRTTVHFEYSLPIAGREVWFSGAISPMSRDQVVLVGRDITDRKRAAERLRASEQRFRALVEHSSDVITLLAPDGTVIYASQSTQPVLGYGATENVGRSAFELVHPDDRADALELFGELMQRPGHLVKTELRALHKDGSWRRLE